MAAADEGHQLREHPDTMVQNRAEPRSDPEVAADKPSPAGASSPLTRRVAWLLGLMRSKVIRIGFLAFALALLALALVDESNSLLRQVERLATLGEVAAGIAHEMNQPLAAIAMAAENGLRLLNQAGRVEAKLTRIVEHAHRLSQITDAVCLFGRTDGHAAWEASVQQVLMNVRVLVKPRLLAAGAALNVEAPDDLPLIKGSPVALEQALMNLVANSCDAYGSAAGAGEGDATRGDAAKGDAARAAPVVRIVVRADADQVRITVADRAGGIPADLMDRIFNPFFTTKPPGKGTGLGLSVTYARITEMGGRITVRNRDGGAVFEILMPAIPDKARVEMVA